MAESIIIVNFDVESEAYQAFSELKRVAVNPEFVISEACIVKNYEGRIIGKDAFDSGQETTDDSRKGSLVGSLVGVLGGPVGIIICGGMGYILGRAKDIRDRETNASLIERVCASIPEGTTAIVALVSEMEPEAFNNRVNKFSTQTKRIDAAAVAAEVDRAREIQRQIEKETRQKLREEKKEASKKRNEARRAKIKADFERRRPRLFHKK